MIKAEGLTMHYGPVVALEDVSFEVDTGEIVALLGPNGAGKSTTIKILTTYLHPTSGSAEVNGVNVLENPLETRRQIGIPQKPWREAKAAMKKPLLDAMSMDLATAANPTLRYWWSAESQGRLREFVEKLQSKSSST